MSNEHFKRFEQGFGKHIETPPMYYAKIPIKRDVKTVPKYVWLPFILLHEVLFSLMLSMPADPNIFKFPDNSGFQQMVNDFRSQFHIPSSTPVIPLGFHGDGVPIQKRKSAEVYSWNICIPPFTKRQYFGCLQKEFFCGSRERCVMVVVLYIHSCAHVCHVLCMYVLCAHVCIQL